jgi:hypothetical protein
MARARALSVLHKPAEAAQDWDRALALALGPLRSLIRLQRAASLAQLGQHAQATAEVEDILKTTKLNAPGTYDAACVFALAAARAGESGLTDRYGVRAVALLREAAARGFRDMAHVHKDTDLDALRQQDDFRQLLSELKGQPPPRSRP